MTRFAVTAWVWLEPFGYSPIDDTITADFPEQARRIMRDSLEGEDIQCIEVREEPAALDAGGARAREIAQ